MKFSELWRELKDRRVLRVAIGYTVVAAGIERVGAGDDDGARPHLTRGRSVVITFIAVTVIVAGWRLLGEPVGVGAEGIDNHLFAVVPFRVSSGDESLRAMLREGVLDILSPYLSDDPRMLDPSVMLSAWRNTVESEAEDLSEGQAVELARRLGAGRVIVGSFVGTAESFTASIRLLQVPGGGLVGDATVEGSSDELGALATRLSGAILSIEAGEDPSRVEYLSQVPSEALEEYLAGRRLYRRTAYLESREAF